MNGKTKPGSYLKEYSWQEVRQHTSQKDRWVVIDEVIYDVTEWQKKHPGGARILGHYAGQDATDASFAMHKDMALVSKILKSIVVGKVSTSPDELEGLKSHKSELIQDYRQLHDVIKDSGLFRPNPFFYIFCVAQLILLEILAYLILCCFEVSWPTYLLAAALLATSQAQAGWAQHDYGHLSVFSTSWLNHLGHNVIMGVLKGACAHWWQFRHNQHHVKTNIIRKDPDIAVPHVFLLGTKQPIAWAQRRRGFMPYQYQHIYFWLIGPPTLLPFYFMFENLFFIFKRRGYTDALWIMTFYLRFFLCYVPILGVFGTIGFYFFIRFLESHWFVLVTQMNHITMDVDNECNLDWVTGQALTTCNVEPSIFNDWFTGHLNFQIEHHLFPKMPRHNYHKVRPLVKALFKKHGLVYAEKSLLNGILDIHRCLKQSGQIWYKAYKKLNS
nr:front-end fatty acid desaturase group B isoform 1 [Eisenia fetida]